MAAVRSRTAPAWVVSGRAAASYWLLRSCRMENYPSHLRTERAAQLRARYQFALDGAGMAAELGDHETLFARDRDVVDAGASGALALDRARHQPVAAPGGIEERDGAVLCDGAPVVGVAGEGESGIGEREDIAAVAEVVAVDHGRRHRHGEHGMARLDRDQLHAEAAARLVV